MSDLICSASTGICTTAAVSCVPPLLWNGTACILPPPPPQSCPTGQVPVGQTPEGYVICGAPPPQTTFCKLTMTYKSDSPASPTWTVDMPAGCDGAGLELAIAIMLARLLGSP